jgi:hypothetical protein
VTQQASTRSAAQAVESAEHWEKLAGEAERLGDWNRDHGPGVGAAYNKAALYRDAAKSCRMEAETGLPHCVCCLKPSAPQDPYWKRK